MKLKLLALTLLTTTIMFSQINYNKLRKYYLVNKNNDTTFVYGKKLPIVKLQSGFTIFDDNGKRTFEKVNPDNFINLIYKLDNGEMKTLKSMPAIVHKSFYPYNNVFMTILIENTNEDLKKGKVDFYLQEHKGGSPGVMGPNGMFMGSFSVDMKILYFKDTLGMHRINYKYHFKRYPKLLGKKLFKEMVKSKKDRIQFLTDYFNKYNKSIDIKEDLKTNN